MAINITAKPTFPILNLSHPLSQGLKSTYLLHEGSGTTIYNPILGSVATATGGPTWGAGSSGYRLTFVSASTQYVLLDSNGVVTTNNVPFTLAVIFRTTTASVQEIYTEGNSGNNTPICGIEINRTAGKADLGIRNDSGVPAFQSLATASTVNDGLWHLIVATNTGNSGTITIYTDGKSEGTLSNNVGTTMSTTNQAIGAWVRISATSPFDGDIAGCWAWNRALSAQEVSQLAQDPFQMLREPLLTK